MAHQIFQNRKRRGLHVYVSPVNPRVVGSEGGAKEPVSGLRHQLSPARLRGKAVSALHVLVHLLAKVFLYDRYLAIMHRVFLIRLERFEVLG